MIKRDMHLRLLLLSLGTLLSLFLFRADPGLAQANTTIRFAPATAEAPLNEDVTVGIEVQDVQNLYGFDIRFSFDPDAVQVVDADAQTGGVQLALGTFLDAGFVLVNQVDNDAGTGRFAMTQVNPSTPKSGSGNILVVTLRGQPAGLNRTTPLTLENVILANDLSQEIPARAENGTVRVLQNAGPGPTNTPVPTQPAGTPLPTRTPRPTAEPPTSTPVAPTATPRPANTATATTVVANDNPTATPTVRSTRPNVGAAPDDGGDGPTPATTVTPPAVTATPLPTATVTSVPGIASSGIGGSPTPAQNDTAAIGTIGAGVNTSAQALSSSNSTDERGGISWLLFVLLVVAMLAFGGVAFVIGRRSA
jgi:hypothetical protein